VRGIVLDKESRTPIPFTSIVLKQTHFGVAADSAGRFELRGIPEDLYMLEFRHIAYKTRYHVLKLTASEEINLEVELEASPIQLKPVDVAADERQAQRAVQTRATTVITATQIERLGALRLTDVLVSYQAGLKQDGVRRAVTKRNPVQIYLDGARVEYFVGALDNVSVIDNIIDIHQIERIEVSRWVGSSAALGPGTSDYVLQIFTKRPKR
jgi:outer membrane receptor protein involved in Fe transport